MFFSEVYVLWISPSFCGAYMKSDVCATRGTFPLTPVFSLLNSFPPTPGT
jgi:hypothetical protein